MTLMPKDKAIAVAMRNQADDPDWRYLVADRGKYAVVEVYDEDNVFLGVL